MSILISDLHISKGESMMVGALKQTTWWEPLRRSACFFSVKSDIFKTSKIQIIFCCSIVLGFYKLYHTPFYTCVDTCIELI